MYFLPVLSVRVWHVPGVHWIPFSLDISHNTLAPLMTFHRVDANDTMVIMHSYLLSYTSFLEVE